MEQSPATKATLSRPARMFIWACGIYIGFGAHLWENFGFNGHNTANRIPDELRPWLFGLVVATGVRALVGAILGEGQGRNGDRPSPELVAAKD